jgi:hypothetical protein
VVNVALIVIEEAELLFRKDVLFEGDDEVVSRWDGWFEVILFALVDC